MRVFVAVQPVDGRKGIDGLAALVRSVLRNDPLDGSLYVFFSRRRDRARVLYFSHNGYWLLSKRLERGCFHLPWELADGPAAHAMKHAAPVDPGGHRPARRPPSPALDPRAPTLADAFVTRLIGSRK